MGNVTIKVKAIVKALLIIFVVVSYLLVKMVGPLVVLGLVAVVGQAMGFLMTRVDPGEELLTVGQSVELLCQVYTA